MDTITTLATPLAVIALVTIAKDLGLPSRLGSVLALVLGISIHAAATYLDPGLWTVISQGIILGLGGSGIYDVTKAGPTVEIDVASPPEGYEPRHDA